MKLGTHRWLVAKNVGFPDDKLIHGGPVLSCLQTLAEYLQRVTMGSRVEFALVRTIEEANDWHGGTPFSKQGKADSDELAALFASLDLDNGVE